MRLGRTLPAALVLGGAAALLGPAPASEGSARLDGGLGLGARDFRVHDAFTDASADDNRTPDPAFPGHDGAVLAIWKACVEWGSELHGDGDGDPHQPGALGSGGANFDAHFQGRAAGPGGPGDNVHAEIGGGDGVLAYCERPAGDGWRIRYHADHVWQDGPAIPFAGQVDLQGVACHEYGHALGLGHSAAFGATMYPALSGSGYTQRSIAADDRDGLQAIYGPRSDDKPRITGASVGAGTLTITGARFSPRGNEVWFTNRHVTDPGTDPTVKVAGVASEAGGTRITVPIPADAGPGDVLVKKAASGHAALSNAFPVDPSGGEEAGPAIDALEPGTVAALSTGTERLVTIRGSGFTPATVVEVDGREPAGAYRRIDDGTIVLDPPAAPRLGPVTVRVRDGDRADAATLTYVPNAEPALRANAGDGPVAFVEEDGLLTLACAAAPGDAFLVLASPSDAPSSLPGWFDLAIGNGLTQLHPVAGPTIGADGLAVVRLRVALPPGTAFHLQGLAIGPGLAPPFAASNVQVCRRAF